MTREQMIQALHDLEEHASQSMQKLAEHDDGQVALLTDTARMAGALRRILLVFGPGNSAPQELVEDEVRLFLTSRGWSA